MWRFIYYPQWKYETIEKKLKMLEEQGYRLEKVWLLYFFNFKKVRPRKTRYIFTYTFVKEWGMIECGYWLRRQFGANTIPAYLCSSTIIYRITDEHQDLPVIYAFRNQYLRHVMKLKIGYSIAIAAWFGVIFALTASKTGRVIASCGSIASFMHGMYCLAGFIYLKSTHNKSLYN